MHQISSPRQLYKIFFSIQGYLFFPLNTTEYNLSFSKVEGVSHIDAFVTFLIPAVQTAFQGLLIWFCFTAVVVTIPYSGFSICFSRLSLGYDELSPICSSIFFDRVGQRLISVFIKLVFLLLQNQ